MAPPREIPGFYYDEAKRKYFRIEDSKKTVLPDGAAAWRSEGEVKRRKMEAEREKGEQEWRERVRRERVRRVVDVGGGLGREIGRGEGDEIVKEWAGGLEDKGKIKMWVNLEEGDRQMIDCFFVTGQREDQRGGKMGKNWEDEKGRWEEDEKGEGLAWVYAGMDGMGVSVSAAPLDRDRRVNYDCKRVRRGRWPRRYVEHHTAMRYTNVAGIKARKRPNTEQLLFFANDSPSNSDSEGREARYALGLSPREEGEEPMIHNRRWSELRNNYINTAEWSPGGSMLSFVLGTQRGVYQRLPGQSLPTEMDTRSRPRQRRSGPKNDQPPFRGDVLAVDFLQAHSQVVLAGTRSGHICQLDTRTPPEDWDSMVFRHKSSVAHLRSIRGYDILAAGPRNAMCIYDIRFAKTREHMANQKPFQPWERKVVAPAVEFPGYRNEAYIKIGLDVFSEPGYGHGVVAAAHDDCTVGLYSIRDGSRIASADVDKIKAPGVIKAMTFQTLAYDQHPSLFIGVGPVVQKFSF